MSWSTHQQALMREMGMRLWLPPAESHNIVGVPQQADRHVDPAVSGRSPQKASVQPIPVPRRIDPAAVATHAAPVVSRPAPVRVEAPSSGAPDSMGWDELATTVSNCRACTLCEGRTQTVFGVGHKQARWMLIGEAPGEQEDREGEPFVGKAGQLLDNMLRAAKLTRSEAEPQRQVYIANVLKCRPPNNRNPLPEEVARCEPYLRRQVALVQPEVIVAMGRFAVQSVLASQEPIGRLRGRVHDYRGVPVVVTYHPAYLLRNPLDKSRSWEDLCLAHEVLRRREEGAG
jgi:uracil-DNA glycosylase